MCERGKKGGAHQTNANAERIIRLGDLGVRYLYVAYAAERISWMKSKWQRRWIVTSIAQWIRSIELGEEKSNGDFRPVRNDTFDHAPDNSRSNTRSNDRYHELRPKHQQTSRKFKKSLANRRVPICSSHLLQFSEKSK